MKEKEEQRLIKLKEIEKDLYQKGFKNICGIDETEYEAKIIGTDEQTDLAVIKINKTGLTTTFIKVHIFSFLSIFHKLIKIHKYYNTKSDKLKQFFTYLLL